MTIRVGTIVTRFNPHGEFKSCKAYEKYEDELPDIWDICIGIVTNADDDEQIRLKWYEKCRNHTDRPNTALVSQLWEIGQID